MPDELSARQQAIRLRLAGETIQAICKALGRSERWVHKWWQRYLTLGADGLYDLSRASADVANRTPPHIERAVLNIRRRLAAHATRDTRYALTGATTIQTELKDLGYAPIPTIRTIDRILQRANLTSPPLRLARRVPLSTYPGPQAHDSNAVHQVDIVGPRYLKGDKTKYYFLLCKDAFDQAVYAEFTAGCDMERVLPFLIHAWQQLGIPQYVQFDNGQSFYGWGRWPRSLNRVIRLALRLGIQPVFIPYASPQRNGSVENFNGWFQPRLLRQSFPNPAAVRRELRQLLHAVNAQHVHQRLGYQTTTQYRRHKRLRRLPADCSLATERIPVAAGKVLFLRWVGTQGRIDVLGESVTVGRRLHFQYIKAVLHTRTQTLTVHHTGRLLKQLTFKLRIS